MDSQHFFEMLAQAEKDKDGLRSTVDVNGAIFIYSIGNPDFQVRFVPTDSVDIERAPVALLWFSVYGVSNPVVYSMILPIDISTLDATSFKTLTLSLQQILLSHVATQYRGHKQIDKMLFSQNTPQIDVTDKVITISTTEGELLFTFYRDEQPNTGCVVYQDTTIYLDEVSSFSSQMFSYIPTIVAHWRGQIKAKHRSVVTPLHPRKQL